MRKTLSLLTILLASVASWATDVETNAGQLATLLTDTDVTALTLHGTIDARDFRFIADNLPLLSEVDLSDVSIQPFEATKPLFGLQTTYEADALPHMAFFGSRLTSVTLPATLRTIGHSAFAGCNLLQQVAIPESVTTIEPYAFSGSGLLAIDIPATVTAVQKGAFANCTALTQATINSPVIGEQAFMGDHALAQLTLGEALAEIGDEAFHGTAITAIDLSDKEALMRIGKLAFASTPLASATLPQQGVEVGDGAFFNNALLAAANLPADMEIVPQFVMAGNEAMQLQGIIPESAVEIGDYAFYNCEQPIDTLVIPEGVTHIGTRALAGTTGVRAIYVQPTVPPALGDSVWAGVKQPIVALDTREASGNDIADLYAEAEQWQNFYIMRNHLLGDVNHDGEVNVADVTCLINIIMENIDENYDLIAADLNEDGGVNIADLTAMINTVLEVRELVEKRYAPRRGQVEPDETLAIDDLNIQAGTQQTINLYLDNHNGYNALQCDLTLPDGLQIVDVKGAERMAHHQFAFSTVDNVTRIVATSMDNELIKGNSGAIVTITLAASDNANGTIEVENVIAADAKGAAHRLMGAQAQASTITAVSDLAQNQTRVFTQGNVLVIDTAQAGTAQLVTVNGVTTTLQLQQGRNESVQPAGVYIVVVNGNGHKVVIP